MVALFHLGDACNREPGGGASQEGSQGGAAASLPCPAPGPQELQSLQPQRNPIASVAFPAIPTPSCLLAIACIATGPFSVIPSTSSLPPLPINSPPVHLTGSPPASPSPPVLLVLVARKPKRLTAHHEQLDALAPELGLDLELALHLPAGAARMVRRHRGMMAHLLTQEPGRGEGGQDQGGVAGTQQADSGEAGGEETYDDWGTRSAGQGRRRAKRGWAGKGAL